MRKQPPAGPDPSFPYLSEQDRYPFPPPDTWGDSIVAVGGNLSPGMLISAYEQGIFPWFNQGDPILWQSPSPRFVIFPERLHVSASMARVFERGSFELYLDRDFPAVIRGCATVKRHDRDGEAAPGTWITGDIIDAYTKLHRLGWAHSAESYFRGELAGGCYGVRLGRVFFGESMFARVSNASKAAFLSLARLLFADGVRFIDCQVPTDHLRSLGGEELDRRDFLDLLDDTLAERRFLSNRERDAADRRGSWGGRIGPPAADTRSRHPLQTPAAGIAFSRNGRYSRGMSREIRDRYAPSPTGLQHIGGIRTALFNYLFARSQGGKFILRLEDTDRTRSDPAFVQNLYDTFSWLGIGWDEGPDVGGPCGPYVQSERFPLYKKYAGELIAADRAYYCFCSAERLDALRAEREAAHSSETGYDRHCRSIPPAEAARRAAAGEPHTVRLKIPLGEQGAPAPVTRFRDRLLGDIEWKNDDINPDPVLLKSDGFPTYHLANVVDDHLMGISHVLRAQEWIPSTPIHVILYGSFGWEHPEYCHLPMVMGQDGKKLSKRHGATSIDEFRGQGYLPEALINYVALLGCSYDEGQLPQEAQIPQEVQTPVEAQTTRDKTGIYSLKELAERFSPDKLNKAPAIFDYKKLEWYNGRYIRMRGDGELAALALPYAVRSGLFGSPGTEPDSLQRGIFSAAMPLIRERVTLLREIPEKLGYLFTEPPVPAAEEFIPKKADLPTAIKLLRLCRDLSASLAALDDEGAELLMKETAEKAGVKPGDLMMPLRVAITGTRVSPPLFGSLRILGAERSGLRVDRALASLEAAVGMADGKTDKPPGGAGPVT